MKEIKQLRTLNNNKLSKINFSARKIENGAAASTPLYYSAGKVEALKDEIKPIGTAARMATYILVYLVWFVALALIAPDLIQESGLLPKILLIVGPKWAIFILLSKIDKKRGIDTPETQGKRKKTLFWLTLFIVINIANLVLQLYTNEPIIILSGFIVNLIIAILAAKIISVKF